MVSVRVADLLLIWTESTTGLVDELMGLNQQTVFAVFIILWKRDFHLSHVWLVSVLNRNFYLINFVYQIIGVDWYQDRESVQPVYKNTDEYISCVDIEYI